MYRGVSVQRVEELAAQGMLQRVIVQVWSVQVVRYY